MRHSAAISALDERIALAVVRRGSATPTRAWNMMSFRRPVMPTMHAKPNRPMPAAPAIIVQAAAGDHSVATAVFSTIFEERISRLR
jgi:hypothetical protein